MVFESELCRMCLRCCLSTEMILVREDVEALRELGLSPERFSEVRGGFLRLKNLEGACAFLDRARGLCRVYERRPLGCRVYPLVFDEERGVTLDSECPLAPRWAQECNKLEEGVALLRHLLRLLEREYGYRVDWRLFESSSRELLNVCRRADSYSCFRQTLKPKSKSTQL